MCSVWAGATQLLVVTGLVPIRQQSGRTGYSRNNARTPPPLYHRCAAKPSQPVRPPQLEFHPRPSSPRPPHPRPSPPRPSPSRALPARPSHNAGAQALSPFKGTHSLCSTECSVDVYSFHRVRSGFAVGTVRHVAPPGPAR
jgi:hypothetical protein